MDNINLNMGLSDDDKTTTVNINTECPYDLARILKNAGIAGNSRAFNQPATLSTTSVVDGGTINTVTSASSLRSIMDLLSDKFQAVSEAIDDNHPHGSDFDYRTHDDKAEVYQGQGSRDNANPDSRYVPAKSADNPLKKSLKDYMHSIKRNRVNESDNTVTCLTGDLGEASLHDIANGHHLFEDILGKDTSGITVIELDTPGKNEHNFVKGINSSYQVGNQVPFQIQNDQGISDINGKIVLIVTGSQLANDQNNVEQRLASLGIPAHVKLPIKAF